jgi:hypothetical protein
MFNIHKNQYILIEDTLDYNCPFDFLKENIVGYTIYYDCNLNISIKKQEQVEILLLGFILNPFSPNLSNDEILESLINGVNNNHDILLKEIQKLSGRFVLLYKSNNSFIVFNDCCGLRQIYFNQEGPFVMSSSPELILSTLGYTFQVDNILKDLFNDKQFIKKEFAWYGDSWYDSRIKKVLPNHFLNIYERTIHRIDYFYNGPDCYDDIIDYAKSILRGSLEAIHNRYDNVIQPITAGWDSRILLAASKKLTNETHYYLFDNSDEKYVDRIVATDLSKKLGFEFMLIQTNPLDAEFLNMFNKRFAIPRIIYKTSHIQWHFYNSQKLGTITINGNCTEIVRCYFSWTYNFGKNGNATIDELTKISGFSNIFKGELLKWISESKRFSDVSGIGNLDLLYWEQRMGNWGSMYPYEQDIAIEEFSPFNNKNLLYSIFKINFSQRYFPDFKFFRDLIIHLWSDTLVEPINPILGWSLKLRLKKNLKRSTTISSIVRKFKYTH